MGMHHSCCFCMWGSAKKHNVLLVSYNRLQMQQFWCANVLHTRFCFYFYLGPLIAAWQGQILRQQRGAATWCWRTLIHSAFCRQQLCLSTQAEMAAVEAKKIICWQGCPKVAIVCISLALTLPFTADWQGSFWGSKGRLQQAVGRSPTKCWLADWVFADLSSDLRHLHCRGPSKGPEHFPSPYSCPCWHWICSICLPSCCCPHRRHQHQP